jgi:hypothetical protein
MKFQFILASGILAAALAACGGGGGSSPSPTPPIGPISTPTPTASPSSSSTPGTGVTSATGTIVDYDSGAAIANATVIVGPTVIVGATPPATLPSGDVTTTTNASGTFSTAVQSGAGNIMVFTTDGHATLHAPATYTASAVHAFGTLKLSMPTSDDVAWLAAINSDRANNGAPPVVFDELLLEATRLWNNYEAVNNRYVDTDTAAPAPYTTSITVYGSLVQAINGGSLANFNVVVAQNETGGANGVGAEANFRAEGTTGPHFSTIINPAQKWVGTGNAAFPSGQLRFTLDLTAGAPGV